MSAGAAASGNEALACPLQRPQLKRRPVRVAGRPRPIRHRHQPLEIWIPGEGDGRRRVDSIHIGDVRHTVVEGIG